MDFHGHHHVMVVRSLFEGEMLGEGLDDRLGDQDVETPLDGVQRDVEMGVVRSRHDDGVTRLHFDKCWFGPIVPVETSGCAALIGATHLQRVMHEAVRVGRATVNSIPSRTLWSERTTLFALPLEETFDALVRTLEQSQIASSSLSLIG